MPVILALVASTVSAGVYARSVALIPAPPKVAAKSYVLMDTASGDILASNQPDLQLHPASLTKMMTAYIGEAELSVGNIERDEKVKVSQKAWKMGGSTMFLEVGDRVSVQDLLKGIIIVSGNDASVALAEHIAGSEDAFTQLMNNTARKLGMNSTNFVNSSGWPARDHYSSARDLAILSQHIVEDYPQYYGLYAEKYYQYGVDKRTGVPLKRQANRNRLLWTNPAVDGLKTGHTEESGYGLAVTAKSDERRLVAVLMGSKTEEQRADDAQKLLTYGFRFFENAPIKKGHEVLQEVRIWKGSENRVGIQIDEDLVVTVPRGTSSDLKAELVVDSLIVAPITTGQVLGTLRVSLEGETIKEVPLKAIGAVEKGGFFKRLWDSIRLYFQGLFQ